MQDLAFRYGCPITVLNLVKEIEKVAWGLFTPEMQPLGRLVTCNLVVASASI